MFAAEQLLTVLFVSGILFGKNPVNGSRDSCPKSAVVDLNEETPDSSGAVNKSGILFPREVIQYDHVGRFGCMCDIRTCVPFCCPFGHAASSNGCVEDKYKAHSLAFEDRLIAPEAYVFVHDPCQLSFVNNDSLKKYNRMLDHPKDIAFREYCILREVDAMEYSYGICLDGSSIRLLFTTGIPAWHWTCHAVRKSFMLATLIVYSVTPELKNLQGLLLRCYIGSELTATTLFYVAHIWTAESSTLVYPISLWITAIAMHGFGFASTFWLTVMNFDIWWKFRRFRSKRQTNVKEYEKAKFMRYSIYVWVASIIVASIQLVCFIWLDVADPLTESTFNSIYWTVLRSRELPFTICAFCFISMFAATALTIRRQKNEITHAVNDVDRHHKDDMSKQRFNIYLGLFTLMGCYKVFIIPVFLWDDPKYENVLWALSTLHGILVFYIFVWKDDVKRSFWSQVIKMLHKCGACRRPHSTPVVGNENENL